MARLAGELNVKFVLMENVQPLIAMRDVWTTVLTSMDSMGYDLRWTSLSAKQVGAPQSRRRWFALAVRRDVIQEQGFFGVPGVEPISRTDLETMVQEEWNGGLPPLEKRMLFNQLKTGESPVEGRLYATPLDKVRLRQLGNQVVAKQGTVAFRMLAAKDTEWFM